MRASTPLFAALALLTAGLLLATPAAAQATGTITGTVTDAETGEPLPGANVVATEAGVGGAADGDGVYVITGLPAGEYTLRVTFIGYQEAELTATVRAGETTERDIPLAPGVELDEVVVTALGIERETRSLGYSVQEVDGSRVAEAAEPNLVNALSGKVAGVQVTSSSGQPGKAARITIRGNSSFLGDNQPLFVVDGVPISNEEDDNPGGPAVFTGGTTNRGLDLDPNTIANINVLKGAAATALYGSRASNGAVLITTKSGRATESGVPRVNLTSKVRFDENVITGFQDQYVQGRNGYFFNGIPSGRGAYVQPGATDIDGTPITQEDGTTSSSWGPHKDEISAEVLADLAALEGQYPELSFLDEDGQLLIYDPRDQFFQTGATTENALSLSGGLGQTTYYAAVSDLRQEGTVRGTDLNRTSVLAKFGTQLGEKVDVQTTANYVRTENNFLLEGNGARAFMYTTMRAPISYDLSDYEFDDGTQRVFSNSQSFNNPFWLARNQRIGSDVDRLIGSLGVSVDLLPWLTIRERLGVDTYGDTRKEEVNVGTRSRPGGSMFDQKITRRQIDSDLTLEINRPLTDALNLTATLGNNVNSRYYQYSFVSGTGLGIPGFYNVANASSVVSEEIEEERLILSAYGQATLDYADYLYLTLTGRNDWSSTLPTDNNSYFYPSASLGLVFSQAFSDVFDRTPLSFGKVRLSLAQIGSDAPVHSLSTVYTQEGPSDGQRGEINLPFNGVNGFTLSGDLGNPELKPELSTEYEVGLDLRFLSDRLRLDGAYYNRLTRDQIFEVPISSTTGFSNRLVNAGELRNRGFELTVSATPIQTNAFQWNVSANWSKNTTFVEALADGVENIFLFGFTSPQIRILPGEDGYGVIWAPRFERTDDGELLIGDDGLPLWSDEGDGPIGNVQPDWLANFRTSLSFMGWSASALLDARRGGDVLNFDHFYSVFNGTAGVTEQRGTPIVWDGIVESTGQPNTKEVIQDQRYFQDFYSNFNSTELFVEDGSYLKLRELSLSYAFPPHWLAPVGLQAARITGTGRNLWISSDFTYRDPEGSLSGATNGQGFYHGVTPSTRSYSVGIDLTF